MSAGNEPTHPDDDAADRLIARALESVLDSVPEIPGGELQIVEAGPTSQPWAETAAPPGRNKRPLEELVAEFEARVAANPDARAGAPPDVHPAEAFMERFSSPGAQRSTRSRRRRGRGGQPASPQQQRSPAPRQQQPRQQQPRPQELSQQRSDAPRRPPPDGAAPQRSSRRRGRRRRGRGRGGGGDGGAQPAA